VTTVLFPASCTGVLTILLTARVTTTPTAEASHRYCRSNDIGNKDVFGMTGAMHMRANFALHAFWRSQKTPSAEVTSFVIV
jgi:hypothetical protein